jgi:hypothetical protein
MRITHSDFGYHIDRIMPNKILSEVILCNSMYYNYQLSGYSINKTFSKKTATRLTFIALQTYYVLYFQNIEGVVKTIANNFITDRNSGEVMAVG